jgi:hypothetical protein
MSQQRLHFAAQFMVISTSGLEKRRTPAVIKLQSPVTKFFNSTPSFRLHGLQLPG